MEVSGRLRTGKPAHPPRDPHLVARQRPVEDQRSAIVRCEISTLAALVVRIEEKPSALEAFEKDHAHRGRSTRVGSRESDRVGLERALAVRVAVPTPEKSERVRRPSRLPQHYEALS